MPLKKHSDEWISIVTTGQHKAIRDKGGLICTFTKPSKYEGQDERYKEETEEADANHNLMLAAPELLEACEEALRMYEAINPVGGWQGVEDGLKYAIKKAKQ